jgi:hypothetical protein
MVEAVGTKVLETNHDRVQRGLALGQRVCAHEGIPPSGENRKGPVLQCLDLRVMRRGGVDLKRETFRRGKSDASAVKERQNRSQRACLI